MNPLTADSPPLPPQHLPESTERPLYLQIADRLRTLVASMPADQRLPSENELAADLGVSRFTAARAVQELVDDQLVYRRQGAGSFVAQPALKRMAGELLSFSDAVLASGHQVASQCLYFGPVPWRHGYPFEQVQALVLLERVRMVDQAPVALHRAYMTAHLAARIGLDEHSAVNPELSLYQLFSRAGCSVDSGVERLVARHASPTELQLLALDPHSVVMAMERTSYAANGQVLDFADTVYDARRFAYESRLVRSPRTSSHQPPTGEPPHDNNTVSAPGLSPHFGPWSGLGARAVKPSKVRV